MWVGEALGAGGVAPAVPVGESASPWVTLGSVLSAVICAATVPIVLPIRVGTVPPVKRKATHREKVWAGTMNGVASVLLMTVFAAGVVIGVSTDCTSSAGIVMSELSAKKLCVPVPP